MFGSGWMNTSKENSFTGTDGLFIVRVNTDGAYSFCNSLFHDTFYGGNELENSNLYSQVFEDDIEKFAEAIKFCVKSEGGCHSAIIRHYSYNKQVYWVKWVCQALPINKPSEIEIQCIGMDVTDVKNQESDSKSNEEIRRLSILAEQTINGVVITDLDGRIQWVNEGYSRITGYKLDELKGKKPGKILQGEGTDIETARILSENIRNRKSCDVEILNYTKDNSPYWVRIQLQPYYNDSGEVIGFFALETDVTEKRKNEKEIKERQQLLEKIAELSPVIISIYDLQLKRNIYRSHSILSFLGYSQNEKREFVNKTKENEYYGVFPDDIPLLKDFLLQCAALPDGEYKSIEYRVLNSKKKWEWINRRTTVFERDDNGKTIMLISTFLFVSDKKKAEHEMNDAYNRLIQAKKMAKLGTWRYDLQTENINLSPHLLLLFGTLSQYELEMSKEDFLTRYVHEEDREKLRLAWFVKHTNSNGQDYTEQLDFRGARHSEHGEYYYYSVSQNALNDCIIGTVQDVTERVKMERDLRILNDRLEERVIERTTELLRVSKIKENVIDIVTHDVKNMLGGVLLQGEVLSKHADSLDVNKIQEYSQAIVGRIQDINMVLKDLLELRKLEEGMLNPHMEKENVKKIVHNIGEKNKLRADVKDIELVYNLEEVELVTDGILLTEVVENLVSNAIKFSPLGSAVTLSLSETTTHASIAVKDSGPGITNDDKKRLFTRFAKLSNRPTAGESSTGLGLAITKQLVGLIGGEIHCDSEIGKGTIFTVQLPKKGNVNFTRY